MKAIWNSLVWFIKLLFYESFVALLQLLGALLAWIGKWFQFWTIPKPPKQVTTGGCVPIKNLALKRPDPLLYSQRDLMARGLAVTWDNPDIELQQNGQIVNSWDLEPDTEYEIVARIWNNSTEAPVVSLIVHFSYLSFGIGTISHPVGLASVNLGVKGGPNHPAFARQKWRTPAEAGHYCLQALLEPSDDLNTLNNLGQENTNVGEAHSPAELMFLLRNSLWIREPFHFEVDTYTIPDLQPCPAPHSDRSRAGARRIWTTTPARSSALELTLMTAHERGNHPIPPGWSVDITPSTPLLSPGEEITIKVTVIAPDGFRGRQALNVNAFNSHGLAGGVTLHIVGN